MQREIEISNAEMEDQKKGDLLSVGRSRANKSQISGHKPPKKANSRAASPRAAARTLG